MPHRKPTEADRSLGREMAALRKTARLSQSQVGEHVGLTAQQIGKYERGESSITLSLHQEVLLFLRERQPGFGEEGQASFEYPVYAQSKLIQEMEKIRKSLAEAAEALDSIIRDMKKG